MRRLGGIALLLLLLLAGCGSATAEEPADVTAVNEAAFLEQVHLRNLESADADDEDVLKGGYKICGALTRGDITEDQVVAYAMASIDEPWALVVSWKHELLCPDWYKG